MLVKTEAIVLHSVKYGEQKLIIDMFTRQSGRLSFVASLPKSPRSKLKKQYFQPLTLLDIEYDYRPQQQLQKLQEASLLIPLPTLQADPSKLAISLFACEFLYHALRDETRNEPLFCYITSSLEWLDGRKENFANFHLVFLMHLSRFLGFYPNLEEKGTSAELYFDLQTATFCDTPPVHRDFLMPQEARRIHLMMRMDFATMHLFKMSQSERNRTLEVLLHYYHLHLPAFPELRSLAVLRELFR